MSFKNAKISKLGMDSVDYQARKKAFKRGSPEHPMSPSSLKLFAQCPRKWIRGYAPKQTKPQKWGNLFDCLALTPELFPKRYIHAPDQYEDSKGKIKEWTRLSKTCRQWEEEQLAKGLEVVNEQELGECEQAKSNFVADKEINSYLNASLKQVLVTGEWVHQESGVIIPVECLIDLVPDKSSDFSSSLGDVKSAFTGETSAWGRICWQNGYEIQAAFDLDIYNSATGEERNTWTFLIVENSSPFEPSHKILSQDDLEIGRYRVQKILNNYAVCIANNRWPSYDEMSENAGGWGVVRMPKWAASQEEPKFELDEEEADEMPEENEPLDFIP